MAPSDACYSLAPSPRSKHDGGVNPTLPDPDSKTQPPNDAAGHPPRRGGNPFAARFPAVLRRLMDKYKAHPYEIWKVDGIDRGYVSRLLTGEKHSPTIKAVLRIDRVLAGKGSTPEEGDELLEAAGYAPIFGPRYRDGPKTQESDESPEISGPNA